MLLSLERWLMGVLDWVPNMVDHRGTVPIGLRGGRPFKKWPLIQQGKPLCLLSAAKQNIDRMTRQ